MRINKKFKLWEATNKDDFRPSFEYIFFENGHAYATNAHILVKVPLSAIFEEEPVDPVSQLSLLNGHCMNAKVFRKLTSYGQVWIEEVDGAVQLKLYFEQQAINIPLKKSDDISHPNFEAVLQPKGEREPIDAIGLSYRLLTRLANAMGVTDKVKLSFTKKDSAIFVEPCQEWCEPSLRGVIMPVYVG